MQTIVVFLFMFIVLFAVHGPEKENDAGLFSQNQASFSPTVSVSTMYCLVSLISQNCQTVKGGGNIPVIFASMATGQFQRNETNSSA